MPTNGFDILLTISNNNNHDEKKLRTSWNVQPSMLARSTRNQIRDVVEAMKINPNPEKPMIPLSIGDPTTFGNLQASEETIEAVRKSISSSKYNGYAHSTGHESARQAIAKYSAHQGTVTANDVIICSGCSSSLELCILTLAEAGQNILVPRPGFPLYKTLSEGLGIEVRFYDLLPDKNWEADIAQMESLIDEKTAALLINNPGNPCGSVFSREHLKQIVAVAERNFVPIIADEIYEHFVFPGTEHIAVSSLTEKVPVLACSGLTKRFLVPGWRMGWIVIHDRQNILKDASKALKNMAGRILGSNTIIQGAIPDILEKTPQSYFDGVIDVLYNNAQMAYDILKDVPGLRPIMPSGAMYMMIGINIDNFPEYQTDLHFVQDLVNEQSVFCLPGSCFEYPNFMRIVLTVPDDMLKDACSRIAEFCEHHYKIDNRIIEKELLNSMKY